MKISQHISYGEGIASATAQARGIKNIPPVGVLETMKHTAEKIFEPVRLHFGKPIKVSSFYRSPVLNKAIGGSSTSQHCLGEALDMDGDTYGFPSNKQIFEFIRDNLKFDQLIVEGIENGRIAWVHCSIKKNGNRNQILFMYKSKGKTVYEPYTLNRYFQLVK